MRMAPPSDACGRSPSLPMSQENLKLSPAMLSRFDLIFVLLDRPDEMMDQALSEHIMALHSGEKLSGRWGLVSSLVCDCAYCGLPELGRKSAPERTLLWPYYNWSVTASAVACHPKGWVGRQLEGTDLCLPALTPA